MSEPGIDAILVRRNRKAGVAAILASIIAPSVYWLSFHIHTLDFHAMLVSVLAMQTAIATAAAWLGFIAARREPVVIRCDGTTIHAGAASLANVRHGVATALANGRYRVDLTSFPRAHMRLEVGSAEEARAILAGVGLDRRAGTTRFGARWASAPNLTQMIYATLLLCFVMAIFGASFSWALMLLPLLVPVAVWLLSGVDVTVGADGVHARSRFHHRFAAHADIERVYRRLTGVTIVLRSGRALALDTSRSRDQIGLHVPDPIYDAIMAAFGRSKEAVGQPNAGVTLLAKGSRSTHDWIASLREIGSQRGSGYRVAPIDDQELFGVVNDAQASTELRAAAAIALSANPDHAPRLRVAADDLADPIVRRVVLAATEKEPTELELELDQALIEHHGRKAARAD